MNRPANEQSERPTAAVETGRHRRPRGRRRLLRTLGRLWFGIRRQCRHLIAHGLFGIGRLLPHRGLGLGRLIGRLWYRFGPRKRDWAYRNIDRVFGAAMNPAEKSRLALRSFESFGMALLELVLAARWDGDYLRRVVAVDGIENWRRASAAGKGVIAVSGHIGSWELRNSALHLHTGAPVSVIAVGYADGDIDRKVRDMRSAHGVHCYGYADRSLGYLTALRRNGAVALLIDRSTDKVRHIEVDFLGMRAKFPTGFAHMARQTGAAILPNFVIRDAESPRLHRLLFTEPIFPDPTREDAEDIGRMTQLAVSRLEAQIRRHPEQWAWMLYPWYDETDSHGGTRRPPWAERAKFEGRTAGD